MSFERRARTEPRSTLNLQWFRDRWVWCVLVVVGTLVFLRSCVPQLWGPYLPAAVVRKITDDHTVCIGTNDVPIWPGDPRQAQCSSVRLVHLVAGVVPPEARGRSVTKAVCYELTVEHPYWETIGQTRHEILTSVRTYFKVAILQNGVWNLFADEDTQDRARWLEYGCPAPAGD